MITLIDFVFSKIWTPKTWSDKCLESPVLDDPSTSNMVNVAMHCSNLRHSTFIIFIDHYQVNEFENGSLIDMANLGTAF